MSTSRAFHATAWQNSKVVAHGYGSSARVALERCAAQLWARRDESSVLSITSARVYRDLKLEVQRVQS